MLDIDKSYNLTYGVDKNGLLYVNSKLYYEGFNLDEVLKLDTPNGLTYRLAKDTDAPEDILTISQEDAIDIIDFKRANGINTILRSGRTAIRIIDSPNTILAGNLVSILNAHSKTRLSSKALEESLKNKTAENINKVVTSPQNQLIANIAIDTVTEEPKEVASNTVMGNSQRYMCSDNAATKYVMQVQNMVGKEVIGIVAVSLKSFFAASAYYNQKLQDLLKILQDNSIENKEEVIKKELDKIIKVNPLTKENTTLANLNFLDLIEYTREFNFEFSTPIYLRTYKGTITYTNLYDLFVDLYEISSRNDAALTESALLSLATDNAKELALSKLNATSKLVDIYTYLLSLGTSFRTISDVMTSPMFNMVAKIAEGNLFKANSKSFDVKGTVGFYLNRDFISGIDPNVVNYFLGTSNPEASVNTNKKASLEILNSADGRNAVINALNKVQEEIKKLNAAKYYDPEMYDDFGDEGMWDPDAYDFEGDIKSRVFTFKPLTYIECKQAEEFFKTWLDKEDNKEFLATSTNIFSNGKTYNQMFSYWINDLNNIYESVIPGSEEMSMLGALAGINQGVKTDLYKNFKWRERIEGFINRRQKAEESLPHFDFVKFLEDPEIKKFWIDVMNDPDKMITHNVLEVITSVPHFSKMLDAWLLNHHLLTRSSARINLIDYFAHAVKPKQNGTLNEQEYVQVKKYVSDLLIINWLQQTNIKFTIPDGFKKYNPTRTLEAPRNTELQLNTPDNLATFKRYVELHVIPKLTELYKDNKFIKNLTPYITKNTQGIRIWYKLSLPMMDIDKSQKLKLMYNDIVKDFMSIMAQDYNGMRIGDIFYLYNLIVNKDAFGQNSLTRLFETIVNQENASYYINNFYEYIANLDTIGDSERILNVLGYNIEDLRYRISKYVPETQIKPEKTINVVDNKDYTFDFPVFHKAPQTLFSEFNINLKNPTGEKITMRTSEFLKKVLRNFMTEADDDDMLADNFHLLYVDWGNEKVWALSNDFWDSIISKEITLDEFMVEFGVFFSNTTLEYMYKNANILKHTPAFISNGNIYINVDVADITDLIHEWSHLLLAGLKWSKNSELRNKYYEIVSAVVDDPNFNIIAKEYSDSHGSDLQEEVFCKLLQMYLQNKVFSDDTIAQKLLNFKAMEFYKTDYKESENSPMYLLTEIFNMHKPQNADVNIYNMTLAQFFSLFADNDFLNEVADTTPEVLLRNHQKIASLKDKLVKNKLLTLECN